MLNILQSIIHTGSIVRTNPIISVKMSSIVKNIIFSNFETRSIHLRFIVKKMFPNMYVLSVLYPSLQTPVFYYPNTNLARFTNMFSAVLFGA